MSLIFVDEHVIETTADVVGEGRVEHHLRPVQKQLVGWPAAVFLVTTGPLRAGVVQQAKPNLLPEGALAVEPDSVDFLDLYRSAAAPAAHPQKVL
jgi:hypothetical protein